MKSKSGFSIYDRYHKQLSIKYHINLIVCFASIIYTLIELYQIFFVCLDFLFIFAGLLKWLFFCFQTIVSRFLHQKNAFLATYFVSFWAFRASFCLI